MYVYPQGLKNVFSAFELFTSTSLARSPFWDNCCVSWCVNQWNSVTPLAGMCIVSSELRTCTFLNSFITFYTYFPTFLGLTRALLNTLARCTLLLCNGVMAPDWRISTISHHTVSGGTKCIVHCYIMAVTNWSFNNSACSPVYDTLMCDCIFLGRPRQSFQKINGVQHSHSRGRQCFHPLPGNWSKSGQPAPGNMLQ